MGFSLDTTVPVLTVFLQGLLSFFSPCVLPLLPLYMGYLAGGTEQFKRKKVMINTCFFVLGISFTFFILGLGVSVLGSFFTDNQTIFARVGGIVVVLFGLYQLGFLGSSRFLSQERRLPFSLDKLAMSPLVALLFGFTFSFAWTPCVGPALTSVLIMSASASTRAAGLALIGVYTLGFVIPFLVVGVFTTQVLQFFKERRNLLKYTVKIGGVLLVVMGLLMFTGKMNAITGYLSGGSVTENSQEEPKTEDKSEESSSEGVQAVDFTLLDQYDQEHSLADYEGKVIFLNFWATWCPPCKQEMPDIQAKYEYYQTHPEENVVILGVAAPGVGGEESLVGVKSFLEENGYTYPVLMDDGSLFSAYRIQSYPTTYMINKEGKIFGYVQGMLSADMIDQIITQTREGRRK
ncbi:cytochrome c biogenesis protein/redoxin [Ohessyouella blattaphilus]|uniref:Redoxin domain-containing protein n=1 Tax=Ohessyouella blattaphilus TaxID=2949333 RepID=A0ABT1EDF9_9FIRM|nr:cytochrome c biogenesis protein/redoxin [Ohessyouella blattaphilus]MCP1108729.1 redoxin domain-containing protein [Ohessyouella blattaphilus]MCR8562123.1 redoxin domain-containing protein [Ohessyouella blattaphilus]